MSFLRVILNIALVFTFAFQLQGAAGEFPETRSKQADLFPFPQDNYVAAINPPGFSWLAVDGVMNYRFTLKAEDSQETVIDVLDVRDNVYVPRQALKPGRYEWTVSAYDDAGRFIAERRPYKVEVPAGLIEQPLPDMDQLIAGIPDGHSRLIFLKENIDDIKASLSGSRKAMWEILKKTADSCLDMPAPHKPTYDKYDIKTQYTLRRMEYQRYYRDVRPAIDKGMQALSLAYLLTGEKKYAAAGKRLLLEVASWDPHGITSSNHGGFDEVGLSLARCTHRAYDWLYDALTEEERKLVRDNCIERARDTYARVGINRPFHRRPGSSHDGRLIGYIGEQAIVLKGEAPDEEVKQWLTYSLEAFMTVYPHWGSDDGGWAEGLDYGPRYNMFISPWIEGLRAVSDVDLWQQPFFRNVRNFFTSCTRPNAEHKPFGDGAEINLIESNRHTTGLMAYLMLHALRHDDPAVQWWAEQLPQPEIFEYYPVIPMVPDFQKKAELPAIQARADYFSDVGWVSMHSDFSSLDDDVFLLFKSSPYASVSHSHAHQNAFHISVGGRALCIASGYYGPVYGMPHHADWTRSTKANNCVLINGKGQTIRDFTARGEIADFAEGSQVSYTVGNAREAYKGLFNRCDRHVMFVRPGLFLILDDLEAPDASTYQWMLHTLEPVKMDVEKQSLTSVRKGAELQIQLASSLESSLTFTTSDTFDTPYLTGVPEGFENTLTDYWHEVYHRDIDPHYHFEASTQNKSTHVRIAAILSAGEVENAPDVKLIESKGWQGGRVQMENGFAEVWAKLDLTAPLPASLQKMGSSISEDAVIIGVWLPEEGKPEVQAGQRVRLENVK